MKKFAINLQGRRGDREHHADALLALLNKSGAAGEPEVGRGYTTLIAKVRSRPGAWVRVRTYLDANPGVKAIVTCEGKRGWDDYLLLHHFRDDQQGEIDKI